LSARFQLRRGGQRRTKGAPPRYPRPSVSNETVDICRVYLNELSGLLAPGRDSQTCKNPESAFLGTDCDGEQPVGRARLSQPGAAGTDRSADFSPHQNSKRNKFRAPRKPARAARIFQHGSPARRRSGSRRRNAASAPCLGETCRRRTPPTTLRIKTANRAVFQTSHSDDRSIDGRGAGKEPSPHSPMANTETARRNPPEKEKGDTR